VPEAYRDPAGRLDQSYLTGGSANVLRKAVRALSGEADAGDGILSRPTSLGGGKSHVGIALWHLARHTNKLRARPTCADLRLAQAPE
jgi:predicted AAA+ superfamily ATPase